MKCVGGRTSPALWERAKKDAQRAACKSSPARCGTWDARIAQSAGRIYREKGGSYCGPRTKVQRSLRKWTREDWTTESGEPACRTVKGKTVCDRYLPAKAWKMLSPQEKAATQRAKRAGRGQFVPNTPAAKRAGKRARQLSSPDTLNGEVRLAGIEALRAAPGESGSARNWTPIIIGAVVIGGLVMAAKSKTVQKLAFSAGDPTDRIIASLASRLQPIAREFVTQARAAGHRVVLASGTRTVSEQNSIYAQGRTLPGNIVTNAKGGESPHNFGLAFDFAFGNALGRPTWPEDGKWADVGAIGKQLGLVWGGDFQTFKDRPHLEAHDWRAVRLAWKQSGASDYTVV